MNSTAAPKAVEPDDALAARADERLVHAYDQIARADEQLARLNEQLSRLEQDAANHPSALVRHQPPRGRQALRGFIGLLLAVCIFAGAFVSQSSYGEAARSVVAQWAPPFLLTSSPWMEKPQVPAPPDPSGVQLAAATPLLPQPTPSAQTAQSAPQDAAPPAGPTSAELAQLLQTMARDLANLEQGIEQLKAGQEQAARENAKVTEELKAGREQMTRLIAREQSKGPEQNLRPRPGPPPRPTATQKPVPERQSPQARARPQPPRQLQSEE